MKIPINLASQPFRRDRAMLVAPPQVAAAGASLSVLITLVTPDNVQWPMCAGCRRVAQQIAASPKQQADFEAVIRSRERPGA
jgi:hypothetical protein